MSNITMAISYFICHNMGFVFFRNRRQFVTEKKTIKFLKDPRSKLAFDKYFFSKMSGPKTETWRRGQQEDDQLCLPPNPPKKKK